MNNMSISRFVRKESSVHEPNDIVLLGEFLEEDVKTKNPTHCNEQEVYCAVVCVQTKQLVGLLEKNC